MRRITLRIALALVATAVLQAGGRLQNLASQTQAPQAPPPGQTIPVFRTGTELVRLDVRIVDADGRAVSDITADEVEVFEGGERRPVLLFQHVIQPAGSYAEVAQRTIASEVSTNQGAPRGNVYVLVFDVLHITPGNEQRARQAAERFLRARLRPGDRVALYALPGPGPHVEFTPDRARAIAGLDTVRGSRNEMSGAVMGSIRVSDAYEITRGNQEVLDKYVTRAINSPGSIDAPATAERQSPRGEQDPKTLRTLITEDARTTVSRADSESRQFLQAFSQVVGSLRDLDGRKSVILFSEGFEIDNVRHEVEDVAAAAARSYSIIYAVDLNTRLTASPRDDVPTETALGGAILSRLESIGSLAADTSGELFNDAGSQVDRVLERISEAAQDYYLVGFEPGPAALSDRAQYRRIKVAVKRLGVRASTRSGYSVGPPVSNADRRRAIEGALRAPFSQQGLKVEYTTYVLRGGASDLQRVMLSLEAELPVSPTGVQEAAAVVFAVRDVRDGRLVASGSDAILLPQLSATGRSTGTGYYRVQFEVPAGQYLMRAVVREPGGLLGSADRRFQVRALGGPSLTAGDLILTSADTAGLPVRTTVYADEVLSGVLELYGRTTEQVSSAVVTARLLPVGKTEAVTSGRADLKEVRTTPAGSSRGAEIEIPLRGIPPGEYIVRATVRSGTETVTELYRDVVVVAGSRPGAVPAAATRNVAGLLDPDVVLKGDIGRRFSADVQIRSARNEEDPFVTSAQAGLARFGQRDYQAAAANLKICVDLDATNAPAAFLLGWARAAGGDDVSAVSAWRGAIVADPTMVPAYLALIDAYLRLGQPDLALSVARTGQEALPASAELSDRVLRLQKR
jgi:VWFA-related protein